MLLPFLPAFSSIKINDKVLANVSFSDILTSIVFFKPKICCSFSKALPAYAGSALEKLQQILGLKNTIEVKMSLNDTLANTLSLILIDEKAGRNGSNIRPSSKIIKKVLEVMKSNNYIGDFEEIKDGKGNTIKLNLIGNINKCGVVKPMYSVKKDEFEKFEKRYLLARGMGILIVSTPFGIITHNEAKKKGIGGKLLAY